MLTIKNISVVIENKELLHDIFCEIIPARITIFLGASGAGKTTILKSCIGLIKPNTGTIFINNKNLNELTTKQRAHEIGYVAQDFNLFNHFTILQNCIDPLLISGTAKENAEKQAKELLKEFGLKDHINKYPHELSGGQKQRVAIVRALCLQPKILLFDEPTSSLDPQNTNILIEILQKLKNQGLTIGISSQDMSFVRAIFDRVYFIDAGKITEFCDKIEYIDRNPSIKKFLQIS